MSIDWHVMALLAAGLILVSIVTYAVCYVKYLEYTSARFEQVCTKSHDSLTTSGQLKVCDAYEPRFIAGSK